MSGTLVGALALALLTAFPAAAGVLIGARRTKSRTAGGLLLLTLAALLPLVFAYGVAAGIGGTLAGGTLGLIAARRQPRTRLAVLSAAVALAAVVPVLTTAGVQIQRDESFDRCAAERAVAIADRTAAGGAYPPNLHELALLDTGPYVGSCYVSNGVNWLYRSSAQGYTLGYWVDWKVSRRVCLHSSGTPGWSCGFESWGPFRPGRRD